MTSANFIQVELYRDVRGGIQLTLEILLTLLVAAMAAHQLRLMLAAQRHEGSILAYHTGGLDTLALLSTAMLVACLAMWWTFVVRTSRFNMQLRYPVYRDTDADVFPLELLDGGRGLQQAVSDFELLEEHIVMLQWYYALHGINILMLLARMLHLMHFHPRLGVVTRSLVVAMPDLFNFLLVGGVVFVGYAMMGHLIFGAMVIRFRSFPEAIVTCLEIVMGDPSINEELKNLPGLLVRLSALSSSPQFRA
jgi:hypothetical protein